MRDIETIDITDIMHESGLTMPPSASSIDNFRGILYILCDCAVLDESRSADA